MRGNLVKARDTLFIAYDKAPSSRKVVYRLGIISLKLGHFDEAADCYEEFVKLAPKDPNQYILRYKILKAQKRQSKNRLKLLKISKILNTLKNGHMNLPDYTLKPV